ncbi:MAG: ATP-binding protein [Patescibacteria group bacterium]|jgi:predicted AAA+ superfamily ATPase|nr:ATP-binding protein [Patescibacteria group bacterium]
MQRHLDESLKKHFLDYKQILILLGSRQVGKTTIAKKIFKNATYLLVDNEPVKKILESYDIESYKSFINFNSKTLIIDEIHLLSNPGRAAKILYDQLENINLIITGSSSFHIKNKTSESLAGRKIDYNIYPLTFSEFLVQKNIEKNLNYNILENILSKSDPKDKLYLFDMETVLNSVLIYGQYPQNINNPNDKKYLINFVDSLIFKDILELKLIEDKKLASNLLKILASQIGNLINYSELSSRLGADIRTIKRYIEIFEQSFIIFRLYPYSKNKRNEISKAEKIYFYDNGIRNAILLNFSDFNLREDKGALFENFIVSETKKQLSYTNKNFNCYYWRNKQKSEIDLVLESSNELIGVEIKCKKRFLNKAFINKYPNANLKMIT